MVKILFLEKDFDDTYLIHNRFNTEIDSKILAYFNFIYVSDFDESIRFLKEQSFDLFLIRFILPDRAKSSLLSTGLEIQSRFPLVPIIFLTDIKNESLIFQVLGKALNIYIAKKDLLIKVLTSMFLSLASDVKY